MAMRTQNAKILESIYEREGPGGAFIITTRVDDYSELFNYLDPAPFRRRDLDQDFLNYVNQCSEEIPLEYQVSLQIQLPGDKRDEEKEERVRRGIKSYYVHWDLAEQRKIHRSHQYSLVYAVIGLLFILSVNFIVPDMEYLSTLIYEGLHVGGWVFLWEAFAELAFKSRDISQNKRRIRRAADAPIRFISVDA